MIFLISVSFSQSEGEKLLGGGEEGEFLLPLGELSASTSESELEGSSELGLFVGEASPRRLLLEDSDREGKLDWELLVWGSLGGLSEVGRSATILSARRAQDRVDLQLGSSVRADFIDLFVSVPIRRFVSRERYSTKRCL